MQWDYLLSSAQALLNASPSSSGLTGGQLAMIVLGTLAGLLVAVVVVKRCVRSWRYSKIEDARMQLDEQYDKAPKVSDEL